MGVFFTITPSQTFPLTPQTYSITANSFVALGGSTPKPDTVIICKNNQVVFNTDSTITLPNKQFPKNTSNTIQVLPNDNIRMLARKLAAKHNSSAAMPAKLFFADLPNHEDWKKLGNFTKAATLISKYMTILEEQNPTIPKDADGNLKLKPDDKLNYTPIN